MRVHLLCLLIAGAAPFAGGGCNHLVYAHQQAIGVDVSFMPDQGTARLMVGYDADTFAVVPRYTPLKADGGQDRDKAEAMSLVSVSNVEVEGLNDIIFNHAVITGKAAVSAVTDERYLRECRRAVFGAAANPN